MNRKMKIKLATWSALWLAIGALLCQLFGARLVFYTLGGVLLVLTIIVAYAAVRIYQLGFIPKDEGK